MKVAYFSHPSRPNYEYEWFARMPIDELRIIDDSFDAYPQQPPAHVKYCTAVSQSNKWFDKVFHSTARLVTYAGFEKYIKDVDVVIVLEIFSSVSAQIAKYCHAHNKKLVVLVYELIPTHPLYYLPTHIRNRWTVTRYASHYICVSNMAKESLRTFGIPEAQCTTIYPGIDTSLFASKIPHSERAGVMYVGALAEHKGIDMALALAQKLSECTPAIPMTFIGSGGYHERLKTFVATHANTTYLGRVDNKKLPVLLTTHALYVLPCRDTYRLGVKMGSEQFGFSFVEAMACGMPIVSSTCGAIPEIVTNRNVCVAQGDTEGFIRESIRALHDLDALQKIGSANSVHAKACYSLDTQARTLAIKLTGI